MTLDIFTTNQSKTQPCEYIVGITVMISPMPFREGHLPVLCSVRDAVAGRMITVISTFFSVGEFFGRYGGNDYPTPQLAINMEYTRDVMARSNVGQDTSGKVHVGCPTNWYESRNQMRWSGFLGELNSTQCGVCGDMDSFRYLFLKIPAKINHQEKWW